MNWILKHRWLLVATLIGAVAGFLYWRFIGCLNGHCLIQSNPYISTGYGALLAYLLAGLIRDVRRRKAVQETNTDSSDPTGDQL